LIIYSTAEGILIAPPECGTAFYLACHRSDDYFNKSYYFTCHRGTGVELFIKIKWVCLRRHGAEARHSNTREPIRMIKKVCLIVAAAIVIVRFISYSFLFGKLFPYSPLIIGFSRHDLGHTVIYVQHGTEYSGLKEIDALIPKVEAFHELTFRKKPRLFIFKDDAGYRRRSISKARFCAFYNGDVVISPWALREVEKGEISLEIYLRHELSHSLLHQHAGLLRAYRYPAWLLEGIAVYSAGQMGASWYPSKEETYEAMRNGNFMPPEFFKTRKEDRIPLDVKYRMTFMYSEFACIVDYLIETYGKETFLSYMKALLRGGNQERAFKNLYGIEFDECIQNFRNSVNENMAIAQKS